MTCLFQFISFLLSVETFFCASSIANDLWEESQAEVLVKFHYCRTSDKDPRHEMGQVQKFTDMSHFLSPFVLILMRYNAMSVTKNIIPPLPEKCPYSEVFGSLFYCIWLNVDQKNSEYGHFSSSALLCKNWIQILIRKLCRDCSKSKKHCLQHLNSLHLRFANYAAANLRSFVWSSYF